MFKFSVGRSMFPLEALSEKNLFLGHFLLAGYRDLSSILASGLIIASFQSLLPLPPFFASPRTLLLLLIRNLVVT